MDAQGCDRRGKFFGGCKFEPRYDEPVISDHEREMGRGQWEAMPGTTKIRWVLVHLGDRIYVHDVCVRCGKTAVRPPPPTPKEPA